MTKCRPFEPGIFEKNKTQTFLDPVCNVAPVFRHASGVRCDQSSPHGFVCKNFQGLSALSKPSQYNTLQCFFQDPQRRDNLWKEKKKMKLAEAAAQTPK